MIDKMVVQPFDFAHDAFVREAQTARDGAATLIAGGAANLQPVKPPDAKPMLNERMHSLRDNTGTVVRFSQPIANAGGSILPVDVNDPRHAYQLSAQPHTQFKALTALRLFVRQTDERQRILLGDGAIKPWQPLAQIGAIGVDECEENRGFRVREQTDFQLWIKRLNKHGQDCNALATTLQLRFVMMEEVISIWLCVL